MNTDMLLSDLKRDEGLVLKPYRDTVGKLTIGIGRNLDDVGINENEALYLAKDDIFKVTSALDVALPWWRTMSEPRQRALANMAFNLGVKGLMGFRKALAALQDGDYAKAADEFLDSTWRKQVGNRAVRITDMIRGG